MLYPKFRPILIGIIIITLLIPLPSLTSFSDFGLSETITTPIENSGASLAYSSHAPIVITSNSDFVNQGWSGQGSSSAPFLIYNLNITSSSAICILIANTTSYFKIQNCWLSSEGFDWEQGIITLSNVINGRIENNLFATGHIAICVEDSSNCIFSSNIFGTSMMAFRAYNIHDSEFSENTQISESMGYPIHIEDSTNVDIMENVFQDTLYEGIGLTSCEDCYVAFNTLSGTNLHQGQYGLALRNSRECILTRNDVTAFGTAIIITDGQLNTISMNYINSCWGGINVRGNDMTISDNEISVTGVAIQLRSTFRTIVNSNLLNGTIYATGFEISGGGNSQVADNIILGLQYGMRIQGTVDLEVSSNRFSACFVAITFEDVAFIGMEDGPPVNCRILNNQLEDCGLRFGITTPEGMNHEFSGNQINGRSLLYLYGVTNLQLDGREYGQVILADCEDVSLRGGILDELILMFCTNCEISGVTIINRTNGVYIRYSSQIDVGYSHFVGNDVGIRIESSTQCHIINTNAYDNGHGLLLDNSPNSMVYDCDLYDNEFGIVLIGAHNSYIETNRIYRNIQGIYLLRTEDAYIGNNDVLDNIETGLLLNRGSRFNRIIANRFGWNTVNVLCTGFDNIWDDGVKRGNSWSDLGDSIIYMIDEDDFDRFPSPLQDGNSHTNPESNSSTTNSIEIPEILTVAVGAVAGFSLLGLITIAVSFTKRKELI